MMPSTNLSSYDNYYTNPAVAEQLIEIVKLKCNILQYEIIIEPSAGLGSFSKQLQNCIAYDIDPKDLSIIQQDFLTLDIKTNSTKTLIIGNPPFGRQSSLALKFIKKSMQLADTVAFILPKSFLYFEKKNIPLQYHLIYLSFINFNLSFYRSDRLKMKHGSNSQCIFQIYQHKDYNRIPQLYHTKDFEIHKEDNHPSADVFIQKLCMSTYKRLITTKYEDIQLLSTQYKCLSIISKNKSKKLLYDIFTSDQFAELIVKYSTSMVYFSVTSYVLLRIYHEYLQSIEKKLLENKK